jgi:hypothetical protein
MFTGECGVPNGTETEFRKSLFGGSLGNAWYMSIIKQTADLTLFLDVLKYSCTKQDGRDDFPLFAG